MARIIYSINGDGFGHATRSIPIIQELRKHHTLKIIASSKKVGLFLKQHFPNVSYFEGLSLVYQDNRLENIDTLRNNFWISLRLMKKWPTLFMSIKGFKPDVMITDFEHTTGFIAELLNIPKICVCNIHAVTSLRYKVPEKYKREYYKVRIVIETVSPRMKHHFITSFFKLPVKQKNVHLFPPVIRDEIRRLKPRRLDNILVYQTSATNTRLIDSLRQINNQFIVYGFDKSKHEGHITFKKFNQRQFFLDFQNCYACISNGGFSFLSEAIFLKKPVLSIPIEGQFEQTLNALQLARDGFGEFHDDVDSDIIESFINRCDKYHKKLIGHKNESNEKLLAAIEKFIRDPK